MSATIATSIPANYLVDVVGEALSGGGSALDLIGLMLSKNNRVPNSSVLSFPTAASVGGYFGLSSTEYASALVYFGGFTISTAKPGALLIANYPIASVGAYLRGGTVSGLPLTSLQAISGLLTVSIDGTPTTSSAINLSTTTSFSAASQSITNALGLSGPVQAATTSSIGAAFTGTATGASLVVTSVTGVIHIGATITGTGISGTVTIVAQTLGTTGGAGTYTTSASTTASSAAIVATSTVLDVTVLGSGTIQPGGQVTGAGTSTGTYINAFGSTVAGVPTTGTGGIGTYSITLAQQVVSESMPILTPTVTYDSILGAFTITSSTTGIASTLGFGSNTIAAPLKLTQATGAVTSQGSIAATPSAFMTSLTNITTNWATFFLNFDPDAGSGNTQKQAFAGWVTGTANRYAYVVADQDSSPTQANPAITSLGYILQQNGNSGTVVNYEPAGYHLAAFLSGAVASINFNQANGRQSMAFKGQSGLQVGVTSAQVATNLAAQAYNFYGQFATANTLFQNYYPGQITGPFAWIDSYVNQIWLTNSLQLAMLELLNSVGYIPYNSKGYGLVASACLDPINAAINFGAITVGVPPSNAQAAIVNAQAGLNIAAYLTNNGYYLQILPASAQVRATRGSPPMTLWYMDGESIQHLQLASINVQ